MNNLKNCFDSWNDLEADFFNCNLYVLLKSVWSKYEEETY